MAWAGLGGTGRKPDCDGVRSDEGGDLLFCFSRGSRDSPPTGAGLTGTRVPTCATGMQVGAGGGGGGQWPGAASGVHSPKWRAEWCGLPQDHVCQPPPGLWGGRGTEWKGLTWGRDASLLRWQ